MRKRRTFKKTKVQIIFEELSSLNVGDTLNKKDFVMLHWSDDDWFVKRTFDVSYCQAKKLLPERQFKSNRNELIKRTL